MIETAIAPDIAAAQVTEPANKCEIKAKKDAAKPGSHLTPRQLETLSWYLRTATGRRIITPHIVEVLLDPDAGPQYAAHYCTMLDDLRQLQPRPTVKCVVTAIGKDQQDRLIKLYYLSARCQFFSVEVGLEARRRILKLGNPPLDDEQYVSANDWMKVRLATKPL